MLQHSLWYSVLQMGSPSISQSFTMGFLHTRWVTFMAVSTMEM